MPNIFTSQEATAFASHRPYKRWFVGEVSLLIGRRPFRLVHECLALRDTPSDAQSDAVKDAEQLVRLWGDQVRI